MTCSSFGHAPKFVWIGPDGSPLPFRNFEEIEDFLASATIVAAEDIGSGVTKPKKILLAKDGKIKIKSIENGHKKTYEPDDSYTPPANGRKRGMYKQANKKPSRAIPTYSGYTFAVRIDDKLAALESVTKNMGDCKNKDVLLSILADYNKLKGF